MLEDISVCWQCLPSGEPGADWKPRTWLTSMMCDWRLGAGTIIGLVSALDTAVGTVVTLVILLVGRIELFSLGLISR